MRREELELELKLSCRSRKSDCRGLTAESPCAASVELKPGPSRRRGAAQESLLGGGAW